MLLTDALQKDKKELQKDIEKAEDAVQVSDALVRHLDAYRVLLQRDIIDSLQRQSLNDLCAVAAESCRVIAGMTKTEITIVESEKPDKKKQMPVLVSIVVCLAVAVLQMFENQPLDAGLAGAAAVAGYISTIMGGKKAKSAQCNAAVKPDAEEILRRFESTLSSIDHIMESAVPQENGESTLSRPLLESLQMLMEAQLTEDGSFALRTIPQVETALTRDGIVMLPYSDKDKQYFDLLPAPKGGETIRPALMQNGVLIARGQATIGIEG